MNLLLAFILGMSCTWGFLEFIRVLPFEEYFKTILRIVVPIPPVLIALVMLTQGAESTSAALTAQYSLTQILKTFIGGAFSGILVLGAIGVLRNMAEEE